MSSTRKSRKRAKPSRSARQSTPRRAPRPEGLGLVTPAEILTALVVRGIA